jgi:hypothetical protein
MLLDGTIPTNLRETYPEKDGLALHAIAEIDDVIEGNNQI